MNRINWLAVIAMGCVGAGVGLAFWGDATVPEVGGLGFAGLVCALLSLE